MLTRLIKRLSGAAVLCLTASLSTGSWAFMDYPAFEKTVCTRNMAQIAVQAFPFGNEYRKAQYAELLADIFENKRVCRRWHQEISSVMMADDDPDERLLVGLMSAQYCDSLLRGGYMRLSAEDRRFLFEHALMISSYMDAKTCANYLFSYEVSLPTDLNEATSRCFYEMSDQRFARFMDVMRRAFKAEMDDFPQARTLSANEVLIAQKTLENAGISYFDRVGEQEALYFYEVIANPQGYPYADQCKAGRTLMQIITDLDGTPGDLVRLMLMTQE